jgi:hypothetical protein
MFGLAKSEHLLLGPVRNHLLALRCLALAQPHCSPQGEHDAEKCGDRADPEGEGPLDQFGLDALDFRAEVGFDPMDLFLQWGFDTGLTASCRSAFVAARCSTLVSMYPMSERASCSPS